MNGMEMEMKMEMVELDRPIDGFENVRVLPCKPARLVGWLLSRLLAVSAAWSVHLYSPPRRPVFILVHSCSAIIIHQHNY